MKKILLGLTVSLSLTVAHGQTAVYHPFPDSHAVWRWGCNGLGYSCCCSCNGICIHQTEYQDSIDGDTIIGSYTYKKIWSASVSSDYYTGQVTCAPWGYQTIVYSSTPYSYTGAIRQDTSQKKIYLVPPSSTQDTLLYDFNLNIGDTLPPSAIYNSENYYIFSIDSILIGGNYHKRFWLWNINDTNPPSPSPTVPAYIEGIGSSFGLFSALFDFFEYGCGLTCVQVNALTIYPDSSYNCLPLDLTLSINENENNFFGLTISPNPFSAQTVFQTDNLLHNATLMVDNCFGQTVAQIKNINGQTITFHRDNLASGLYFVRLTEENKTIAVDKLVITNK